MKIHLPALCLALVAAPVAGCAAGTEAPEAVGYVLLDQEARTAGELTQGGWSGAPILPAALEVAEPVAFSSSAGRTVIDLRPGMVAWVHGAGGAVEWKALRDEVSDDRLRVQGSRDAAAELAQRLAGQLVGPVDGGGWMISAPDVFDRGSFLAVPEGITEAMPEPRFDLGPTSITRRAVLSDASGGLSVPARQAMLVGVYTAGELALFLDAAGGFSLGEGCSLTPVDQGRWHTEGDQIVLEGTAKRTQLAYDPADGTLGDPDGARYSSALVDSAIAAMPQEEP